MVNEPLTKDKIKDAPMLWNVSEKKSRLPDIWEVNPIKVIQLEDVASAVRLLREKIGKRKLELEKVRPVNDTHEQTIASAIFELMFFLEWIDEVFGKCEK